MARPVMSKIALLKEEAESGVDYSPRVGALCPACKEKAKIYKTLKWEDNMRIRYHRCQKSGCFICSMGITIKSIEVDTVEQF